MLFLSFTMGEGLCVFIFVFPARADIDWRYATDKDIQVFLDKGEDINKQDEKGNTIFMYRWKDINLLKKFIEAGADVNIRNNNGETVLWEAVREDKLYIVEILLDNGAQNDLRNNSGEKVI